jgi:hypothetical protein
MSSGLKDCSFRVVSCGQGADFIKTEDATF